MLLNIFIQWLIELKTKTNIFYSFLLRCEHGVDFMLLKFRNSKNYDKLQTLEEVLRRCLLKTLEAKGDIGSAMVRKDIEMNKELIAKIQAQSVQEQSHVSPQTKPRFNVN